MKNPNISIVVPSYSQSEFLLEALDSVWQQTVHPYELIIVDDGSTDNSYEIAERWKEEHGYRLPTILVRQVNKGLASARNTGIMNATGDYILPLDADDKFFPYAIEEIVREIEATDADIIAPSLRTFGLSSVVTILDKNLTLESFRAVNRMGYFSAFRRSKALEVGGYSPKMVYGYEDLHFWIDLLKRGATISVIQEPLVYYRIKESSMMTDSLKHHGELWEQITKDHPELWT